MNYWSICLFVAYCLSSTWLVGSEETPTESTQAETRWFTEEEIAQYDGSDPDKPIYMSVKGTVFDVTSGKSFYGKGQEYNALVGGDRSCAVAKMSLELEDLARKHDVSSLTKEELKGLEEIYNDVYLRKYPVVGKMTFLMEQEKEDPLIAPPPHADHSEL